MSTISATEQNNKKFSTKAFLQGLGVVFVLLMLLFAWVYLSEDTANKILAERLASQTIIIEWKEEPIDPTVPEEAKDITKEEHTEDELHTVENNNTETEHIDQPIRPLESGLAAAPIEGLHEETSFGAKPVIRSRDGLTAFQAYRRPFDVKAATKPIIALAITDLGLSDVATESAVRSMPPQVSFILSPYSETVDFWTNESRERGHEIWLTLPVENQSYPYDDPGPHTMLINAPERENQLKMQWLLSRTAGYIGFVTSYQPIFISEANDMRPIVGNIYNSGLAFVDGSMDPSLVPQTMAAGMKAPYSNVDVWVDRPDASQEAIREAFKALETKATKSGFAVGIINPLPVSFQEALKWIETLPKKGYELVPLSATTGM